MEVQLKKRSLPAKRVARKAANGATAGKSCVAEALTNATVEEAMKKIRGEIDAEITDRTAVLNRRVGDLEKEVDEKQQQLEKLRQYLIHDEHTGLYNPKGFLTIAQHQFCLARRTSAELVFLFLNMEGKKPKPYSPERELWEQARLKLVENLRGTFRCSDVLGRMGEDEYAIHAVDATRGSAKVIVSHLYGKMQRFLSDYNSITHRCFDLKLRAGVMRMDPKGSASIEELIVKAGKILLRYKISGQVPQGEILPLAKVQQGEIDISVAELIVMPLWNGV
jgi:GGDEF domain-containing protein